jgi:NitT/TauT family transport system ATP-binding protein
MQKAANPISTEAPTETPLIEFRNVGKTFWTDEDEVEAVRRIDLTARNGEFISLIGPSGCGKSTLLNMTAGLFEPTVGDVLYGGRKVTGYNLKTGYMTQNDHLLPWRNVVGNLAVPLEIQGLPRAQIRDRVDDLVNLVGLKGFEKSYPSQLSGGMRKRAALARLLAYDPDTLLLDEPFAALDAQLRLKMQIELLSICHSLNKTIIFVTHDLDEAAALSDRIAIFSARPGTIIKIIKSPLARDRDLLRLRHDSNYVQLTAELWDMLTPGLAQTRGEAA